MLYFLIKREYSMKIIRFLPVLLGFVPCLCFGAQNSGFQNASQLLTAARRGDVRTVQVLINSGADINYVDATGLSLVCTAVMNNDKRAIQILQMYGADASQCDRQIKNYKQKTRKAARGEEYNFFSGLSSSHVLALSALGVAAVVGGIVLLTDVFDDDNGIGSSSGGGSHSGGGGGGGGTTTTTPLFSQNLPYGPTCENGTCPSDFSVWENDNDDFDYMSDNGFNYLMVARAYNSFVRGYLGMTTIRLNSDKSPFDLSQLPYASDPVGGGRPISVAMITGNGVNATGSAVDGLIPWIDAGQIATVQSVCALNGSESAACQNALAAATSVAHKYFNYTGATSSETENTTFDLSGSGSVFGGASDMESKLAKIIGGWEYGGRDTADYYGFIPNGQLVVYKTGAGKAWVNTSAANVTGAYTMTGTSLAVGNTFTLNNANVLVVTSVDGDRFVATDSENNVYNGYLIGDDLFVDSNSDGSIDQMYTMGDSNVLTLVKETTVADYKNYYAINDALRIQDSGYYASNVVANLSLTAESSELDYVTVAGAKALNDTAGTIALQKSTYKGLIDNYYNLNTADDDEVNEPSTDAELAFNYLGNYQQQIWVNSAGRNKFGLADGGSLESQFATFENFAPVVYSDLQNLFMTVVAVSPKNGTDGVSIDGYTANSTGKLQLSQWLDENDSSVTYSSRICGLTGTGNGGAMNPWCFAAPGTTDLEATAAMAGAVASVKSAFTYITPKQMFLLLALTADGPYLGTNPSTGLNWASDDDLVAYLRDMYTLPPDLDASDSQYIESFKNAFGYGMINLERATRPNTNVYFYDSNKNSIVSSSGKKAYWRSASTMSRASNVLSLTGRGAITTSFYDIVESADGTISLPRVWNSTVATDTTSGHGLYMGDMLADFDIDSNRNKTQTFGDFEFSMSVSPRAYNDNLGGLDNMRVAFVSDDFDVSAEYQRHLTDGQSRFNGRANGLLALASNTVSSDAEYKSGNFGFGVRAFSGVITDESLLENDPVVSSQFEPGRLGFVNGAAFDTRYNNDKFALDLSVGVMRETNTVLGMYSDGLLSMRGGNTQYVDMVATYKPTENIKLFARGTFADTVIDEFGGVIANMSDIKSNAFALGADIGGFGLTIAMPLAVVDGHMGYSYADFNVVENGAGYSIAMNNPHMEYVDLSTKNRELRLTTSYKTALGAMTNCGVEFMYRLNPNNTATFGDESIIMFKVQHRLGI